MTTPFFDELISAYLDGELTAQEQARVETQLRDDVQLRKMCDELRALRFTLQALPTADPSEDLAERVLRQAERRMLLGEEETGEEEITPAPAKVPLSREVVRRQRDWWFAWKFVAAAAALVLVFALLIGPANLWRQESKVATGADSGAADVDADALDDMAEEELSVLRVDPETLDSTFAIEPSQPDTESSAFGMQPLRKPPAESEPDKEVTDADGVMELRERVESGETVRPDVAAPYGASSVQSNGYAKNEAGGAASESAATRPQTGEVARPFEGRDARSSRGGVGGMGGGAPGANAGGDAGFKYFQTVPQLQKSIRDPAQMAAGLAKPAVAPAENAQRLVRHLAVDQSLLVQVSLPQELERRFLDRTVARHEDAIESEGSDRKMLEHNLSQVELSVPSSRGRAQLPANLNQPLENVILVEGAPKDLQETLAQLAKQPDVTIQGALVIAGRQPDHFYSLGTVAPDAMRQPSRPQPIDETENEDMPVPHKDGQLSTTDAMGKKESDRSQESQSGADGSGAVRGYSRFGGKQSSGKEIPGGGEANIGTGGRVAAPKEVKGRGDNGPKENNGPKGIDTESAHKAKARSRFKEDVARPSGADVEEAMKEHDLARTRQSTQADRQRGLGDEVDKAGRREKTADGESEPAAEPPHPHSKTPTIARRSQSVDTRQEPRAIYLLFRLKTAPAVSEPAREK